MNANRAFTGCLAAALAGLGIHLAPGPAAAQPIPADVVEVEEGVEVLTRGPVHEAFAETVTFNPVPGVVVPKAPPDAIEEVPPDQRPEGDHVAWIPGYWAWDDERNNFLWISGIWRVLPPGRQWVPGYWGEIRDSFQWTSGYWADATVGEIEYLPEPPATVEAGPNITAPSPDHSWLPGCWVWHQTRYAWHPGYWAVVQPDWVWVPAYYVWAPRGYVFVNGYWDHSVPRRGVLFAPVYFNASIYSRRGFHYSPATVISLSVFSNHLFLRPSHNHYYFGDFYAASYFRAGFRPSCTYNSSRHGYDPIYAHERWQHRQDQNWDHHAQADYQHRRDHEDARPPRTWAAQKTLVTNAIASGERSHVVASRFDQMAISKDNPLRLQPVDKDEQQKHAQHSQEIQKFRQDRQHLEAKAAVTSAGKPAKESEPARVKLPPSPIISRSADQLGKNQTPPQRHEHLKPNPPVEPKPSSKVEPKRDPKVEPKPSPKIESKPPKIEPRIGPKVEPGSGRIEPKPPTSKLDSPRRDRPDANRPDSLPPKAKRSLPAAPERPRPNVSPHGPTPRAGENPSNSTIPPRTERSQSKPQPQPPPKIERPAPQTPPQPRTERPTPQPQVERPARQPQVERPARQPQVERPARQPQVERSARQSQGKPAVGPPAAGPKPERPKDKGQGKRE